MAIAYDASSSGAVGANTNLTYAHTCSAGANTYLAVYFGISSGSGSVSSVTYNGTSMTQLATVNDSSALGLYAYYLVNPSSGTNNVSITTSGSGEITSYAVSYTGVNQITPIDSFATGNTGSTTDAFITLNTTVVVSNCWLLGFGRIRNSSGSATISSNRTDRQAGNHGGYAGGVSAASDSNGTISTGSQGFTWTIASYSGNLYQSAIVYSLTPHVPQTVTLTAAQASYVLALQSINLVLTRVLGLVLEQASYVLTTFDAIIKRTQTFRNKTKTLTSWVNRDKQ